MVKKIDINKIRRKLLTVEDLKPFWISDHNNSEWLLKTDLELFIKMHAEKSKIRRIKILKKIFPISFAEILEERRK